jgi:hypothetical protein
MFISFHLSYLVKNGPDSFLPLSTHVINERDEQQVTIAEPSITDESSPLLQHDRPTYEKSFSGFASFFPHSCCRCCSIT